MPQTTAANELICMPYKDVVHQIYIAIQEKSSISLEVLVSVTLGGKEVHMNVSNSDWLQRWSSLDLQTEFH